MKNLLAAVFTLFVASTIFIGCGFVDDNPGAASYEDDQQIESKYNGFYSLEVDTTGFDRPG